MASLLLRALALGFAIAATPGPIFFVCLRRGVVRGWLYGLVSGFGVATADAFYAAVAVFGIGAVATLLAGERRWLAVAGSALLIVVGVRILFERVTTGEPAPIARRDGLAWAYVSTLGLTLTNPATIVTFAALAATLGAGISGGLTRPALVVAGVALGSTAWWLVLAALSARLRARVSPGFVRGLSTFSGLAIIALGLAAALSALTA